VPKAQASGQSIALGGKRYKVIFSERIYRPCSLFLYIMVAMKQRNPHLLLPAVLSAGSFFGLLLIMLLSDPVQNVSYTLLFFAVLLILLLGLGYFLMALKSGRISPKSRSRVMITSILIVIILMFRSAGSLNWVDTLVILLLAGGLLFYSGRRPY